MRYLFFIVTLMCLPFFGHSNDSAEIAINKRAIEFLQNDIKEVRRDQLNYQIEKNLLKEAYSSNYTTIQIIISIILGIFAILGYLGIKSITSLKKRIL